MALRKVKGNLERMFDKNLTDLVRGIRNNKDNEAKYIAQCIEEIKLELRQDNISVKSNAVAKLTYLQMLGYDISWAGFNIIEVMSSPKFTHKRIGYLAASQSFHQDTELLMLTTNMIRKDLNSQGQYDAGVALSGLACFIGPDLARDLANDIMTLLASTKPYLRKKAVLMMYKVFLRFPEALRPAFPRLREKLEDPDSGVQSAAVNVVCELARKNPKNYLSLAPVFFKLMTTSTNNWMLIKIIKLFGALTPLEPRLGKKLIEPLTNLIHSTSAMSLLYECINTVIAVLISISSGMPNHSASIQLCVQKLRILIEDTDQNLKYLGLLAMSKILRTHPKSVQAHKDLILQCLDDKDESIRLRALDLLYGMVSKKTLMEIVKRLMVHMDKAEGTSYRDELLSKIVQICSQGNYQYITNFEWYVSVLVELTRVEALGRQGSLVAGQLLDVGIRVAAIRPFATRQMALLLDNAHFLASGAGGSSGDGTTTGCGALASSVAEVLHAAAWICGEFSQHLPSPVSTLEAMLRGGRLPSLPGHTQAVFVHNVLKLFAAVMARPKNEGGDPETIDKLSDLLLEKLPYFASSGDLEVQERASSALQIVKLLAQKRKRHREKGKKVGGLLDGMGEETLGEGEGSGGEEDPYTAEFIALFRGELNPVAPKAQKKVQVPDGLDLDAWINDPPSESSESEEEVGENLFGTSERGGLKLFASELYVRGSHHPVSQNLSEEEMQKRREARRLELANNPHYLKGSSKKVNDNSVADIPVAPIELTTPLHIAGLVSSDKYLDLDRKKSSRKGREKKVKGRKKGKRSSREVNNGVSASDDDEVSPMHVVNTDIGEMPEGVEPSEGEEEDSRPSDDPHRALDINLDEPLRDEEKLPVAKHRAGAEEEGGGEGVLVEDGEVQEAVEEEGVKKKGKKSKKKKANKEAEREDGRKRKKGRKKEKVEGDAERLDVGVIKDSIGEPAPESNKASEDIDMWLIRSEQLEVEGEVKKVVSGGKKRGKHKGGGGDDPSSSSANKEATQKRRRSKRKEGAGEVGGGGDEGSKVSSKEGYEEAAGISTPSKEAVSEDAADGGEEWKLCRMRKLAEDKALLLTCEWRGSSILEQGAIAVNAGVVLVNRGAWPLRRLDLNLSESPSVKQLNGPSTMDSLMGEATGLQVQLLPPGASTEIAFSLTVSEPTSPHKLRATLTYILDQGDAGSSHEKLDMWLVVPCSAYLLGPSIVGGQMSEGSFADLLSSGDLGHRRSLSLASSTVHMTFSQVLKMLCACVGGLTLVEQVGDSASLYARSAIGHHVCMLAKASGQPVVLNLDAKSDCDALLVHLLEELRTTLSPHLS
ncbi:AP-3 complex subunit delta-1 isoform X2 [Ischnura elegans]|uniref:AP-3 complex subunit delta-1 isoform X2 n=1 Tax=Ischnura elegans TaxID=197161 RepID=UPI001ED8B14D|nr:AP-3 complex subunit delta-1 isoform X2 [Ischnura elegans]